MPYKDKEKQKAFQRKHYQDNKEEYRERTKRYKNNQKSYFVSLKKESSCQDCGESDWRCLEYHHLDQLTKKFTISDAIRNVLPKQEIIDEIAKCTVLCSNCHQIRHWIENKRDEKNEYYNSIVTRNMKFVKEWKKNNGCGRCKIKDYRVLDFHHLSDKKHGMAKMISRNYSISRIVEEINKCEIICRNCHRFHHIAV